MKFLNDVNITGSGADLSCAATVTFSNLSSSSETSAVVINSSGVLSKRTLGNNAFNSTTIPTNTNQLTNGAGFIDSSGITSAAVGSALAEGSYEEDTASSIREAIGASATLSVGDGGLTQNNFTNALKTKLDGIEASADVTDATNVAAAGASMKTSAETISGAKTFSALTTISNTTDSSSDAGDNGALRTTGGASIAKKLYVGSTITGSADVIAYSDKKLKENIKTLDGKKVLEMRGVSFDRIDTKKASSGVIAQEIEKVAPELVIDDGNYKGVAYGNLVGYLIEAIKDQQKQINELKYILHGRPE